MNKKMHNKNSKKNGRMSWSVELHTKFVAAVNQLGGIDNALPRKILELMNEENLTRANISSHLQKYKQHIQRISTIVPNQQGSPPSDDYSESTQFQVQDDASYYQSNVNGAIGDLEWQTTSTNSTFNTNLAFNSCDQSQMEHDWIMELIQGTSSLEQQHQVQWNQQNFQNNCIANNYNNIGSVGGLISASSSISQTSQEAEEIAKLNHEIAELRQEMVAVRDENHRLHEIVVQALKTQHNLLMQSISSGNAAAAAAAAQVDPNILC